MTINNLFDRQYTYFLNSDPNPGTVIWDGLTIKLACAASSAPPHLKRKSPCISP